VIRVEIPITTTGADASALGSGTSPMVRGKLHAVFLDYHASCPATADVTVSMAEAPSKTLLTVTDSATDGWYFPRNAVHSTAGAALTYDGTRPVAEAFPITGRLTVAIAGANALTNCVVAYLYIEED